jgi:hypothetical protein
MLKVVFSCCTECRYAECRYAECRGAAKLHIYWQRCTNMKEITLCYRWLFEVIVPRLLFSFQHHRKTYELLKIHILDRVPY